MKIAIELYQIIPGSSGGIVPQLNNLLIKAFALYPSIDFLVYATPSSYRPSVPHLPNVQVIILSQDNFWTELDLSLLRAHAEVLFRTYPAAESLFFPASRQIVLIPDLQHEILPDLFSSEELERRRQAFPVLINSAGAICVYSEYSKQILKKHYPDIKARIILVPPGPNSEVIQRNTILEPTETALIPQEAFFLYPANLWTHKNHLRLFNALEIALKELPEKTSLVLTGDPAGWSQLQAQYPNLPLYHLGFVSTSLLKALYRRALALTYFSLYEGFGMPLLEAFSLGTPVLCSNLPVLQEVGDTAILSCNPYQPEEIAKLLVQISQQAELRQTLVEKGYQQVKQHNEEKSSRNFVQACQVLAEQPIEYKAHLQTLEKALTKLVITQQQMDGKEQVITELNTSNQQRLDLIKELTNHHETLMAELTQHQQTAKANNIWQNQLKQIQAEKEVLIIELERVQAEKEALLRKLDQNQDEGRNQTTELKQIHTGKTTLLDEKEQIQRAMGSSSEVFTGVLDFPTEGELCSGWVNIRGWVFSSTGSISGVEAFLDETSLGFVPYLQHRPDVGTAYNSSELDNTGYSGLLRLPRTFLPGQHQLRLRVSDDKGNQHDYYRTVTVKLQPQLRRLVGARPDETVARRLYSHIEAHRRRELKDKARQQFTNLKNRLFHYHLGILQQYPPRPWVIPAYYVHTKPPVNPPSISIVTPSYNQAHFLERTLLSILDQNYSNLEYIVQDGGSSDHSAEILQKYSDRLTYWESARDKGQSNAINLGLERSTGEIMAYLNSDDLLLPGTLNYIASYFEKHPEIDVIYGQRVIINENDQEIGRWVLPPHNHNLPDNLDILSWADYIPQETMFWRRRIWEKAGGQIDESFQFAMDWDLILRFRASQAHFARLPRFLGAFRVHSTQKSSAQIRALGTHEMNRLRERNLGRLPDQIEIYQHCLSYFRKHVFYHKLYRLGILRY